MAKIKISQLTAKGANLANTDLLPIAEVSGAAYVTKRITGAQAAGGVTLTVGSTSIASGTIGRVLFQGSGNVLEQSANLFWDNTNNALGLGASPATTSRLDIRAKDGLSTSQSFRIRNSLDNLTQFEVVGNGQVVMRSSVSNQLSIENVTGLRINVDSNGFQIRDTNGYGFGNTTSSLDINSSNVNGKIRIWSQAVNTIILGLGGQDVNPTVARIRTTIAPVANNTTLFSPTSGTAIDYSFETQGNAQFAPTSGSCSYTQIQLRPTINTTSTYSGTVRGLYYNPVLTSTTGATHIAIETTTGNVIFNSTNGNVAIGGTSFGTSSSKVLAQYNGTSPGSSPANAFQMYSADIVGGNAAPHFMTENGNIVKLYQETTGVASATVTHVGGSSYGTNDTIDGYTIAQVVKALRNLGILA